MIRLIGPGGAGKSTVGAVLAQCLALPFLDLDREFSAQHGDIDQFIASRGYPAYARANVELYDAITSAEPAGVLALSSGFMTYTPAIHSRYAEVRRDIAESSTTFVLLPSLDLETCVVETVRRQLGRPISQRGAAREEAVIRERFGPYVSLPAPKIETMRPPAEVAAAIVARLPSSIAMPYVVGTRPRSSQSFARLHLTGVALDERGRVSMSTTGEINSDCSRYRS